MEKGAFDQMETAVSWVTGVINQISPALADMKAVGFLGGRRLVVMATVTIQQLNETQMEAKNWEARTWKPLRPGSALQCWLSFFFQTSNCSFAPSKLLNMTELGQRTDVGSHARPHAHQAFYMCSTHSGSIRLSLSFLIHSKLKSTAQKGFKLIGFSTSLF